MVRFRALAAAVAGLALTGLSGCGDSGEPNGGSATDGQMDVTAAVGRFMQARQDGLPADKFLSAEVRAAYADHATGLWLHDDTLPGGPGGQYRDFTFSAAPARQDDSWQVEVRTQVEWVGDAAPSEMVEVLTVRSGVVATARRTDDLADDGLPLAVAAIREKIYKAAVGHDYKSLRLLVDPATFSYSFGEEGDPIGYWRRQERDEIPLLGDVLPMILHTRFGKHEDIYVWPSAAAKESSDWTEADVESMHEAGYSDRDIRSFEKYIGGYAGWRAGIRADGTWLYFISGD
jgi:hypothetical protein